MRTRCPSTSRPIILTKFLSIPNKPVYHSHNKCQWKPICHSISVQICKPIHQLYSNFNQRIPMKKNLVVVQRFPKQTNLLFPQRVAIQTNLPFSLLNILIKHPSTNQHAMLTSSLNYGSHHKPISHVTNILLKHPGTNEMPFAPRSWPESPSAARAVTLPLWLPPSPQVPASDELHANPVEELHRLRA